jgi:hypothetical protein
MHFSLFMKGVKLSNSGTNKERTDVRPSEQGTAFEEMESMEAFSKYDEHK